MKEYNYYFFDLFHTLIRVEPYIDEAKREHNILKMSQKEWSIIAESNYTNRALGLIKNPDEVIECILKQVQSKISVEQKKLVSEIRKKRFQKAFVNVDKSIIDTISKLKEKGKKLVLISNADVFDKLYWNESPLYEYFDESIFSCDVGIMKPNEQIYLLAIDKVNADPKSSVFVGDGGHDELLGAKKACIDTILTIEIINSIWPEKIPILRQHADYVIDHFSELI